MRILIVTQFYSPESLISLEPELAETLQGMGHEVTVLTGFPNYPTGRVYPGYCIKHWQREIIRGIPVIRVPLFPDHGKSAIRRSMNYLSFSTSAALLGPWLSGRVDLVHAIQPLPAAWAAWAISRVLRVPFTMEVQDMWPEALTATGMMPNSAIIRAIGASARFVYRRAAAVRVISNGFRASLIAKGTPADKVHVISNWIDAEEQRPVPYDVDLARQLGLEGRFNVMYAGSIGLPQKLEVVLDAAAQLTDLPNVQFVLVGGGPDTERLQSLAAERGLANVKFLGMWPAKELPRLYALADVLLMHLARDPLFSITIPSKVFSYMSAGRPILSAVEGEVSELVRGQKLGLTCPPEHPNLLANAVREFYAMPHEQLMTMGKHARIAVIADYGRVELVRKLVDMFAAVVDQRSSDIKAG